jgi:hypothetical protein
MLLAMVAMVAMAIEASSRLSFASGGLGALASQHHRD